MAAWNLIVLKFGSSVLSSAEGLPALADEIYRHLRQGKRVLAVVSAFKGQTDALFHQAYSLFGDDAPSATAAYAATGEMRSAALLAGTLMRAGVSARVLEPREAGLAVHGHALDAEPHSIDRDAIFTAFERQSVLVLPGFFGIGRDGQICLLGRGGSDFSALFLAQRLGAECRLIKDVDGIYDRDPAIANANSHRFANITWDAAVNLARGLVQSKALNFAQLHRLPFSVGALAVAADTWVGSAATSLASARDVAPILRVVLLGLGTVGGGVYRRLLAQPSRFQLLRAVVRNIDSHVQANIPRELLSADPWDAVNLPADLVIECMGGLSPAGEVVLAALRCGRTVVTANKAMVGARWASLSAYAAGESPRLRFSAAVGGALPVLETLAKHAGRVRKLRGIINGTCSYVLDAMRQGADFDAAIAAAQRAGFAESDPNLDISGTDSADKLALMARIAFNVELPIQAIMTRGIGARDGGGKIHLVASAVREQNTVRARVVTEELADRDFLAGSREAQNRIEIELDDGHLLRLEGKGAGRWPTTISVCGDVLDVWREQMTPEQRQSMALASGTHL